MNLLRPELLDRLAAEFVLGTLRGGARRRFIKLLRDSAAVREAVAYWQERLLPLAEQAGQMQPPETVWRDIERRLFGAAEPRLSWWQRLGFWQASAAVATALALMFGIQLLRAPDTAKSVPSAEALPATMMYVAALKNAAGDQAVLVTLQKSAQNSIGVVQVDVIAPSDLTAAQVLQLWSIPRTAGAAPRSMGLLPTRGRAQLAINDASLFDGADVLAVSVEPAGGSTTGLPTGPVIMQGKLLRL